MTANPSTQTMRAAVLCAPERFELRDVPRPQPRPHEVLVRVSAVGVCGTDFHIFSGEANYHRDERGQPIPLSREPQILGHEITGVVEDLGSAVRDLRSGDRVVVDQGRNCVSEGRSPSCEYCATGDSHQCEHYREHGITGLTGGFAEYVAVPAVNVIAIRSNLDAASAALTEPLGCVGHSCDVITRTPARYTLRDGSKRVRSALIIGAGPQGLFFTQYLRRVLGYDGLLLVMEPKPTKRTLAEQFGADVIDPDAVNVIEAVLERTNGQRIELLIEASGSGPAFASIPTLIRKQATVVLQGHGHAGVDLSVLNALQFMEPTLIVSCGASGTFESDGRSTTYVRSLSLIESGKVDVGSLITHRYQSLDAVPKAFSGDQHSASYVKGVVTL